MELWTIRRQKNKEVWVKKPDFPNYIFSLSEGAMDRINMEIISSIAFGTKLPRFIVFNLEERDYINSCAKAWFGIEKDTGENITLFLRCILKVLLYNPAYNIFPTWIREDQPFNPTEFGTPCRLAIQISRREYPTI